MLFSLENSSHDICRVKVYREVTGEQDARSFTIGGGTYARLKGEKAFSAIHFISSEQVSNAMYFPRRKQRDDAARAAFREERDRDDLNGLFIRDIIRERILPDDPRIR